MIAACRFQRGARTDHGVTGLKGYFWIIEL
jgi:hypothetical protein